MYKFWKFSRFKVWHDSLNEYLLSMVLMMLLVAWGAGENILTIESWGNGAPELRISAPLGYTLQKHKGPDFDVHYITSKNANDPSIGIYMGHHPNPFSAQMKGIETVKEADVILCQKTEWISWQEKQDGKTIYHSETIIADVFREMEGGGVAGLRIHVFIKGSDQKEINLLKTSARSLRMVKK
jgi:hypothetical protein